MELTTYQTPELRDSLDNVVQAGAYGKNTAFCNKQNTGVLDYINNNLQVLKNSLDGIDTSADTKIATHNASTTAHSDIRTAITTAQTAAETYADGVLTTAKAYTDTEKAKYLSLSGGAMTGRTIKRNINNDGLVLSGGNDGGASLFLDGKDNSIITSASNGCFYLKANNGTSSCGLEGRPDGYLTWNDQEVERVVASGDGYIRYASGLQMCWGSHELAANVLYEVVNFPVAFYTINCITATCSDSVGRHIATSAVVNASAFGLACQGTDGVYSYGRGISWTAIGRWK